MKKFIYATLLVVTVSLSFYSCTEEQIKPKAGTDAGAGAIINPIVK